MSFFTKLWESVFEPGASPVLIRATHGSFIALVAVLIAMFFATYSVHFLAMLVLAVLLWVSTTWFIREVSSLSYKSDILAQEGAKAKENEHEGQDTATSSSTIFASTAAQRSG